MSLDIDNWFCCQAEVVQMSSYIKGAAVGAAEGAAEGAAKGWLKGRLRLKRIMEP